MVYSLWIYPLIYSCVLVYIYAHIHNMAVQTTTQLQIYTFINVICIIYSNVYACHSFTYSYNFISSFELNNFNSYNLLLYLGTIAHT